MLRKIGSVSFSERRLLLGELDQVVVLAGGADQPAQIADGGLGLGFSSGRSRRKNTSRSLVAGLDSATRTSRSSSASAGSRAWCCPCASVSGSTAERPVERHVLVADGRRRRCSHCPRAARARRCARRSPRRPGRYPRRTDQDLAVEGQLLREPRGRRQRRAEVLQGLARTPSTARRSRWPVPSMSRCRPRRVLASSVLKSWSRSTGATVLSALSRAAVLDLAPVVRARVERDVAVGDARERGCADRGLRVLRAAGRGPRPRPTSRPQLDPHR